MTVLNHINLLYSLLKNGIKGRALKLLTGFFSDRYFNVTIGNLNSNDNCVLTGVPQGSILSPLLVGMSSSEHVQTLMYADYLSIITLADIIELETSRLQCGITKLDKWLRYQGFQLITDKSVI